MPANPDRGPGRIEFRADDPSLTPYAGLAISGEVCRKLRLVPLIDAELAAARVAPVKRRRRGLSAGQLAVAIAEAQLAGAECFDDVQDVRADRDGAPLRAVAGTPSAPTARQLACRFKPGHIRAIERGVARAGNELDRTLSRDPTGPVTVDLDATETKVFGRKKRGTGRSRHGHLAYNSYVVTWAERGRALTSDRPVRVRTPGSDLQDLEPLLVADDKHVAEPTNRPGQIAPSINLNGSRPQKPADLDSMARSRHETATFSTSTKQTEGTVHRSG